jgi:hypothetical protein
LRKRNESKEHGNLGNDRSNKTEFRIVNIFF